MPPPLSGEAYFTAGFDSAIVREDLASQDETRQMSALMQVVAYMAAGKDMSGLFSSVAALTSATNVRLKRLTYLYLIQNSRVQAEKAVLQAGTFVKDTFHDSPLYRGAALRTMTSLEVNVMSDFATAPLQRCLRDSDPYVRRIACFGVLKQYCTSPNITLDGELLHILPELLQDRNPAVVAAAVQVMLELKDRHCPVSFTPALRAALPQLLVRLASAGEWALWGLLEGIALSLTPAAARQPFIGNTHMTMSNDADEKKMDHHSRAGASHRGSAAQTSDDVAQRHIVATTASDHAIEASDDNNAASDKDDAEEEEDLTRRLQSGFVARAEVVMTHVMPYLMLNNAAVVIAAVKNVALFLRTVEKMPADELSANERARLNKHYGPILVRALVGQLDALRFEIRYSALRVIELLLSPQPDKTVISDRGREGEDDDTRSVSEVPLAVLRPYFMQHLSCFLLHHDDPIFIKLEKLDVLVSLADKSNGAQILSELMVYVTETDAELVKRSVRSIGYLATTLPDLAGRCVKELQYLIETEIAHIVEDTVVVVQLILQCYPGQFLDIIPTLCRSLSVLQEVESKVAVVWMLGEYTEHIPDAMTDYIGFFIDSFDTQPVLVRLALLSALAKIYLRRSDNASKEQADVTTLEQLIARCVKSPVPDLRDRAFFYWRLLAMDVRVARRIVLPAAHAVPDAQHYLVRRESKSSSQFDKELLALGRLSSVLHISPAQFTRSNEDGLPHSDADDEDEDEDDALSRSDTATSHVTGHGMSRPESASDVAAADGERKDTATLPQNGKAGNEALTNLFTNGKPSMLATPQSLVLDANAASSSAPTPSHPPPAHSHPTSPSTQSIAPTTVSLQIGERTATTGYVIVLPASAANGVEVAMSWSQMDIKLVLNCRFRLVDGEDYVRQAKIVQLQVNRNMFGLGVAQVFPIISLERGDKASEMGLIISCNNQKRPTRDVEVAIGMEEIGVRYCLAPPVPANLLLLPATGCEPGYFVELLNEYAEPAWVMPPTVEPVQTETARMTVNALRVFGLNLVHRKALPTDTGVPTTGYFIYAETIARQKLLIELTLQANVIIYLSIRCSYVPIAPFFGQYILQSLSKTTLPLSQEIL